MAEFGLQGEIKNAREQGTAQDQANFQQYRDWRVVLRLAQNLLDICTKPLTREF